ncbi:MAG: deoxyguanosinetriphosphate triphosphohydrolase [Frankiales bacterium]|nr:deoxyguanosinetriphosphate triphosphohydrolase [Frankiales bacterium]
MQHLSSGLAPYAADASHSRGRLFPEAVSPTRSEFQRDRDRIIHSTAFRRLAHKTQVFVPHEGDHYRTRLTHSIEVGQIARALSRSLRLDEDLAEALALAHDLGHTCFGHTGEDALEEVMADYGGFDHNAQALRIVTRLEKRYARYDGLNLAWETLEGLVKHNGPLLQRDGTPIPRYAKNGIPGAILEYDALHHLELASFSSCEAQAAAIADDVAYNAHDIDDGLRAGLFGIDDLRSVDFLREIVSEIEAQHPGLEAARAIHEITRRVITRFVEDVTAEARRRLDEVRPPSAEAVRAQSRPMITFSPQMQAADKAVKAFLYPHMYRHEKVMRIRAQAHDVVLRLFEALFADPVRMPGEWRDAGLRLAAAGDRTRLARLVCDYIAGMTDRYALVEHRSLFGDAPELR